jgi:hypothetical protein
MKIELDAVAILQHSEANSVFALKIFFVRVDTDIEVIEEQIIVSAIGPVGAAQYVSSRGSVCRGDDQYEKEW